MSKIRRLAIDTTGTIISYAARLEPTPWLGLTWCAIRQGSNLVLRGKTKDEVEDAALIALSPIKIKVKNGLDITFMMTKLSTFQPPEITHMSMQDLLEEAYTETFIKKKVLRMSRPKHEKCSNCIHLLPHAYSPNYIYCRKKTSNHTDNNYAKTLRSNWCNQWKPA